MRIGFNLLPYTPGAHGGAEVYLSNILAAWPQTPLSATAVVFGERQSVHSFASEVSSLERIPVSIPQQYSRLGRVLFEQALLPVLCARHNVDCIVSNYVSPLFAATAQVVVIHDMLYRRFPEVFEWSKLLYWKAMIPASIRRSDAVVCVSEFSANEIRTFYPLAERKLFATVEGIRPSLARMEAAEVSAQVYPNRYFLCVATFGKHKNLHTLLRAFASITKNPHSEISLIFTGSPRTPDAIEYHRNLMELVNQYGLEENVVFMGHVSEGQLAALYTNALALVLPSLYEGFGLPVIEAQFFGCPVLCANAAALPEVAGLAAITFDPLSSKSIGEAMQKVIAQPDLRTQLCEAGYENVSRFSWEKAAAQLMTAAEFAVRERKSKYQ